MRRASLKGRQAKAALLSLQTLLYLGHYQKVLPILEDGVFPHSTLPENTFTDFTENSGGLRGMSSPHLVTVLVTLFVAMHKCLAKAT